MANENCLETGGAPGGISWATEVGGDGATRPPQRGPRNKVEGVTSIDDVNERIAVAEHQAAERIAAAERRGDERVAAAECQTAAERSARLEAVRRQYAEQASRQDAEARLAGQIASQAIAQRDADEAIEGQQAERTARLIAESRLAGEIAARIVRQRVTQEALECYQAERAERLAAESQLAEYEDHPSSCDTERDGQSGGRDGPRMLSAEAAQFADSDGWATAEYATREAVTRQLAERSAQLEVSERELAKRSAQLEAAHRQLAERTAQLEAAKREAAALTDAAAERHSGHLRAAE